MFYFVIFHSSVSAGKDLDKKTLTTFLYGCVLYIIFHALLSTSERAFFKTVQTYFWVIMAIDIVCMLYIYVKLIKPTPGSGASFITGLKDKVTGLLDNFVDMSMYTNDIELSEYPINMHPSNMHPGQITSPQHQYSQSVKFDTRTPGILKKAVSIDESMNEIREIESVNQLISQQIQLPNSDQGETDEINDQLAQLTDSMMTFNNQNSTGDRTRDLLAERGVLYSNLIQPKPKDVPAALQSTSVNAIRKRANSTLAAETVKTMDTKSVLENRAELSNDQLRTLTLNYNPDELVNDVLKRPKFEKGNEPNGVASSRLTKETLQPDSAIWNANKKQDDSASVASSDVGSMLDFDMSEFAQSI